MDVERILRNTPSTLKITFYGDAAPIDADGPVTVTITKPDGTLLGAVNQATVHNGLGTYNYTLAPQANLRRLRLDWTGTFTGVVSIITSWTEVVGGYYFTLNEARNYDSVIAGNLVKYTDEMLIEARTFVETEFERICQRAFVPRGEYELLSGNNSRYIYLQHPEISKIISISVAGDDWTSFPVRTDGSRSLEVVNGNWFPWSLFGETNVIIEYEYGAQFVPSDIKRAALKRMRSIVVGQQNRIDERATLMSVPDFGTFSLATPGRNSLTGFPEIDAVLLGNQWAGGISFG
jgi:hypothetical protein